MTAKPRSEWSAPSLVLTIVLALLAAQQSYFNFNGDTKERLGRIEERIEALRADLREGRMRRDAQYMALTVRIDRLEQRR